MDVEGFGMLEFEFVIKKAKPETAKGRFLKQVAVRNSRFFSKSVQETVEKLQEFDGPVTVDQLYDAGLHVGWFKEYCNVCHLYHDKVVSFDVNCGEYDYDICSDCLRGAVAALEKA